MNKHICISFLLLFFSFSVVSIKAEEIYLRSELIEELLRVIDELRTDCKETRQEVKSELGNDYPRIKANIKKAIAKAIDSEKITNDIEYVTSYLINNMKKGIAPLSPLVQNDRQENLQPYFLALVIKYLDNEIVDNQVYYLIDTMCLKKLGTVSMLLLLEKIKIELPESVTFYQ